MKNRILLLLAALFPLLLCACGRAEADGRVLVTVAEAPGFTVKQNGLRLIPGEDAVFTIEMERGTLPAGIDYAGEYDLAMDGRTATLTLRDVRFPTRIHIETSSRDGSVTYDANGGYPIKGGSTSVTESYSLLYHRRPNTSLGTDLFTRDGYTLLCWNTRADGRGERIGLGSRATVSGGGLTLYAQWVPWADEADFEYSVGETVTVTGYHGSDALLAIPAVLDGKPVAAIAEDAFRGCAADAVILPPGIKTVADGAFADCALRELTLYDDIESIPDEAFAGCENLRTLYINAVEAPYGYVFRKESVYADKVDLLLQAQGRRKLVFYGGCSMWYNLDGYQADRLFGGDYAIINMGLNGTVNSAVQMQILAAFLEDGDILFHAPEISSRQQLMMNTAMLNEDSSLWAGIENNYDLFSYVDLRTVDGVFDSFCHYLSLKDKRTDYLHFFSDDFNTPYIDAYGCIPFYRSGTEEHLADTVTLDAELFCPGALDTLRGYYDLYRSKGVRVYVSYACVNMDAVPETQRENVALMDDLFRQSIESMDGPALISRLGNYLYHNEDFYDTNYHLCSGPASRNTALWLRDLTAQMKADGLWEGDA